MQPECKHGTLFKFIIIESRREGFAGSTNLLYFFVFFFLPFLLLLCLGLCLVIPQRLIPLWQKSKVYFSVALLILCVVSATGCSALSSLSGGSTQSTCRWYFAARIFKASPDAAAKFLLNNLDGRDLGFMIPACCSSQGCNEKVPLSSGG